MPCHKIKCERKIGDPLRQIDTSCIRDPKCVTRGMLTSWSTWVGCPPPWPGSETVLLPTARWVGRGSHRSATHHITGITNSILATIDAHVEGYSFMI